MVQRADIEAKAREIEDTIRQTQETAKKNATWAVAGVVVLVVIVFLMGRRRGREGGAVVKVYKV